MNYTKLDLKVDFRMDTGLDPDVNNEELCQWVMDKYLELVNEQNEKVDINSTN